MNFCRRAGLLDEFLFLAVLFVPVSMLFAGSITAVVLARRPFREDMVAAGQLLLPFADLRRPTGYAMYLVVSRHARSRSAVVQLRDWLLAEFARPPARQT